jgi:hypothetical protein
MMDDQRIGEHTLVLAIGTGVAGKHIGHPLAGVEAAAGKHRPLFAQLAAQVGLVDERSLIGAEHVLGANAEHHRAEREVVAGAKRSGRTVRRAKQVALARERDVNPVGQATDSHRLGLAMDNAAANIGSLPGRRGCFFGDRNSGCQSEGCGGNQKGSALLKSLSISIAAHAPPKARDSSQKVTPWS